MDNCEDLLPEHFRFVRGVVDSQDLSLNISREMLQHNRQLTIIARNIEKKIKSELKAMLENDREKYEEFYAAFGRQLKYGTVSDYGAHKEATQDLLLFYSHKEGKLVSLKEYVDPYGLPSEFNVTVLLFQQGYANNAAQVFSIRCAADSTDHFHFVQGSPKLAVPTQAQMDRLLLAGDGTITPPEGSTAGKAVGVSKIGIGTQAPAEAQVSMGAAVVVSFKDASGKRCTRSVVTYGKALQEIASDYTPSGEVGRSIISQYEVANNLIE